MFTVSTGVASLLPLPSGYAQGEATDISGSDGIAGSTQGRGIVWQRGIFTQAFIPRLLDPSIIRAKSIGNDGTVFGIRAVGPQLSNPEAVRIAPSGSVQVMWNADLCGTYGSTAFAISSPSLKGRVVGCGSPPRTWYNGGGAQLPLPSGSLGATPLGVNTCGTIVGEAPVNGQIRPIIWRKTKCD